MIGEQLMVSSGYPTMTVGILVSKIGGADNTYVTYLQEYDADNDTWTTLGSASSPNGSSASSFTSVPNVPIGPLLRVRGYRSYGCSYTRAQFGLVLGSDLNIQTTPFPTVGPWGYNASQNRWGAYTPNNSPYQNCAAENYYLHFILE